MNFDFDEQMLAEISNIAKKLKINTQKFVQLALAHFQQSHTLENALEGAARINDGNSLVEFPGLKEEMGIDIQFHPMAMDELDALDEEDQVEILEEMINRINLKLHPVSENGADDSEMTAMVSEEAAFFEKLNFILTEEAGKQTIISNCSFGDIFYTIGDIVEIYHIGIFDEEDDFEEEEDDEDTDEEETDVENTVNH